MVPGRGETLALTAAQSGIWFAQRLEPDNPMFAIAQYLDIHGDVDVASLTRAVRQVLSETDALRLRFTEIDDEPRQYVAPLGDWSLPVVDFTPDTAGETAALAWMYRELATPVDVFEHQLFTAALLRVSPTRYFFYHRVHHLLVDGFGAALVVRQVADNYRTLQVGGQLEPSGFGTVAEVLRDDVEYRRSERHTIDGGYWRARFADQPEATVLSDSSAAMATSFLQHTGWLRPDEAEVLRSAARALRTDWSPFVIAAAAAYLHRSCGASDVVLGMPVTARRSSLLRATPAMVSNIVPLRLHVTPATTMAELVAQASREIRAALKHQRYRFEDLRRDLALPRGQRLHGPTVNILPFDPRIEFGSHDAAMHNLSVGPVDDLSIVVQGISAEHGIRVDFAANPARYGDEEVAGHRDRFLRLLRAVMTAPTTPIGAVQLLADDEQDRVLRSWNQTGHDTEPTTVPELFARQASETPARIAVSDGTTTLTFAELDERADRLARALAARGARPGQVVAVAVRRSVDTIIALLAVSRAGAAYLPLDVSYPAERLGYLIEDATPSMVLTDHTTRELLPVPALLLEELYHENGPLVDLVAPGPQDVAYLTYTSGSTGRPKGVVVEHGSLTNLFEHHRRGVFAAGRAATGKDILRVAHLAGVAFDAAWDPVLWLLDGHELWMVPDQVRRDPEECARYLADERVDSIETTPSYVRQLLAAGLLDGRFPAVWALGGEAVDGALWRDLAAVDGLTAFNLYGPTEATVDAVIAAIPSSAEPTIGTPVDNARAYVLDSVLRPVAPGVVGELYLAGTGLARGYHRRPALTAQRFVANPFEKGGQRLYRTGDRVRWSSNGSLEFVGRVDDQAKIRGVRVEPGEVEAALIAFEDVAQAAVLVHGSGETARLVAYTVSDARPDELRERLITALPEYLVPHTVIAVPDIPLTPHGKVDRARLPMPTSATASDVDTAPRTETERVLCRIFADVVVATRVGVDDDFFALGGHSLLATRVVGRVRTELATEVAIRDLFEAPTPAQLAARLTGRAASARPVLQQRVRPERLPLSFAQRRLWFLNRLNPLAADYNMPVVLRLTGELDVAALRAALTDVVARHESLRTIFPEADGEPRQRILTAHEVDLTTVDIAAGDLNRRIAEQAGRGFDLSTDVPLRAHLLRTSASDHVLVLVIHHIAGDGWSFGPLARDLAVSYEKRLDGAEPDLPALAVQYADYALWQRELLGSDEEPGSRAAAQLAYWTDTLRDLPAEVSLPVDRPRPATPAGTGGVVPVDIPARLHTALEDLATRHGASMFMALHAAFAATLTKLGAGTDIVIGTPVAGRTEPALDELVGFFVTTLVLRTDLSGDPSFTDVLRWVRDTDLSAFEHQDLPFERIVEALAPPRVPGRNPLFQVMLTLQNNPAPVAELGGVRIEVEPAVHAGTAKFDLSLDLTEHHDVHGAAAGITGAIEYSAELFDATTVERIAQHFVTLLEAALTAPERPLRLASVLTDAQRQDIVEEWNGPRHHIPAVTLPELFTAQATDHPHRTAVVATDGTLDFAKLDDRANRLARLLISSGARTGQPVAVVLPRTANTVVALLAVLKAGATYLPVDISYPDDRIAYLLADAHPALLVSTTDVAHRLDTTLPTVLLDQPGLLDEQDGRPLPASPAPGDLAYLLYTSGSTGRPKGVAVEHRSLVNLLHSHRFQVFGPATAAAGRAVLRIGHTAGVSFDASWDPILWMVDGHELHLLDDDTRRDPEALLSYVAQQEIDVLETTPSYVRQLLAMGLLAHERHRPTVLALGGEAVDGPLWRDIAAAPDVLAFNFYGPTESTVDSVVARIAAHPVPVIGRGVHNVDTHVLDSGLMPVAPGVTGELYLAGAGLARGYRGKPGLTAERFVADPFAADGSRMYRTGDLVRWRADGVLEFVGRVDDQVKIRGFRVELGEIEAVLASAEGVTAAAVVVDTATEGIQRLIAYVAGERVDTADLRAKAAQVLPDYMVPQSIVTIAELPLTPNGKLDRTRLPAPGPAETSARRIPRDGTEAALCELFAETLGLAGVGVDDDFFALGGHSLLVTRLVSRIRAKLGVDVAIRTVFEAATPAALAMRWAEVRAARAPLTRQVRPERIPLSYAQRRMWFLNGFEGTGAGYHIPMALRLHGDLDHEALEGALGDVLGRHESLRTVFPVDEGVPYQQVLPTAHVALPVLDIEPAALAETIAARAAEPFDLDHDLPIRAALLRTAADEHVLLLVVHHIASDGWSTGPLARDLTAAYTARRGDAGAWSAPALPVQYADYTLWQQEILGAEHDPASPLRRELDFWQRTLAGIPEELSLPYDHPRPAESTYTGGTVRLELPRTLHEKAARYASRRGASLFMVLHAGLATVLSRLGGGTDIPIGTPVAGRTDEQLDELVGFFVNTLVLRTDLSGAPSFADLLDRVRAADLAAFDHQGVPFERVVEELAPTRSLSRHPLFQVMLALQNTPPATVDLPGLAVSLVDYDDVAAVKFDLSVSLTEHHNPDGTPAGLDGTVEYSADLFEPDTVDRLAGWFVSVLDTALDDPERPITELDLLSAGEVETVLETWNDTARTLPPETVVEAFERQADHSRDDIAVVASLGRVSANRLNAEANQLARLLRQRGVGAGHTVGVALPRSVGTVVALLGVLKSGATYLPIDLTYPTDRITYMVTDANPSLVLTTSAATDRLPKVATLALDEHRATLAGLSADNLSNAERLRPLTPRQPAYVIYTSGSTGRPKGVVVEHRSLTNLLRQHAEHVFTPASERLGRRLRVALTSAVGFDASWDPVLWMIAGHELHIIDDETRRDPAALVDYVRDNDVDAIETTPSYLRQLLAAGLVDGPGHRPAVLALGGEAVDDRLWTQLRAIDGVTAYNFYGPTESTVNAVVTSLAEGHRPTIGKPVHNTRAYVLDARLRPVPAGVPGELYLSGAGVARGYLNRGPLTAERFVADPHSGAGERMYRTGDIARWRTDATLEFVGRADDQVKLRGFRVEPGEIAALLEADATVAHAAVVLRSGVTGEQRLVAYVVPANATPPQETDLRAALAAQVPDYMIPAAIVVVDRLPLTPNGKLDQQALPEPPDATPVTARAPRSPREDLLCKLFAETLGLPRVGIDDSFFTLGGHSLLAGGLIARIRAVFGVQLPIRRLFESPTVAGLAAHLDSGDDGSDLDVLLPLRTHGSRPPLFCVHPASGLSWTYSGLLKYLAPDQPLYGLQSRLLTDPGYAPVSIGEIAADYVAQIRSVQPHGPYSVLGWSFGGNLAHEVAAQLEAAGEDLDLLVLLDAYPEVPSDGLDAASESDVFTALLANQGVTADDGPLDRARVLEIYREIGNPMGSLDEAALGAMISAFVTQATLMRTFAPGRVNADLLFFTATVGREPTTPTLTDWLPYLAGHVDNHDIDVRHAQLTQPDALTRLGPILAERLSARPSDQPRATTGN
ncbi:non-ribosomal peptide synthetase [Kibdelosporangium phytohabitans]|uniref:non-ribosomal peptide synthetase n=1 Tax=Kibdelosporangium phytohabitans TaxID=860235 RepID=UPI0007C7537E|nr:non-ribosomal peptide synthetase [Kibdelosporangium phytohabitans]MBE1467375.1 amino acid adenylation domain-containing protein [Kibdelosporangium phytohabitans]